MCLGYKIMANIKPPEYICPYNIDKDESNKQVVYYDTFTNKWEKVHVLNSKLYGIDTLNKTTGTNGIYLIKNNEEHIPFTDLINTQTYIPIFRKYSNTKNGIVTSIKLKDNTYKTDSKISYYLSFNDLPLNDTIKFNIVNKNGELLKISPDRIDVQQDGKLWYMEDKKKPNEFDTQFDRGDIKIDSFSNERYYEISNIESTGINTIRIDNYTRSIEINDIIDKNILLKKMDGSRVNYYLISSSSSDNINIIVKNILYISDLAKVFQKKNDDNIINTFLKKIYTDGNYIEPDFFYYNYEDNCIYYFDKEKYILIKNINLDKIQIYDECKIYNNKDTIYKIDSTGNKVYYIYILDINDLEEEVEENITNFCKYYIFTNNIIHITDNDIKYKDVVCLNNLLKHIKLRFIELYFILDNKHSIKFINITNQKQFFTEMATKICHGFNNTIIENIYTDITIIDRVFEYINNIYSHLSQKFIGKVDNDTDKEIHIKVSLIDNDIWNTNDTEDFKIMINPAVCTDTNNIYVQSLFTPDYEYDYRIFWNEIICNNIMYLPNNEQYNTHNMTNKIIFDHIYRRMLELNEIYNYLKYNGFNVLIFMLNDFKSNTFGVSDLRYELRIYIEYCLLHIFGYNLDTEHIYDIEYKDNNEYLEKINEYIYICICPTTHELWNNSKKIASSYPNIFDIVFEDVSSSIKIKNDFRVKYYGYLNFEEKELRHIEYKLSIELFIPSLIYHDIESENMLNTYTYIENIIHIMKLTVLHHLIEIMYNNENFNLGMDMRYVNQLYDYYYFSLKKFTGGKNKTLTLTTYYDIYMRNKTKYLNFENNVFYQQYLTNKDKYEKLKKS